jgi:ABC-2 type transport system ATP-binding protein
MEEAEFADRIAIIDSGKIVALDTPRALKSRISEGVISITTSDNSSALHSLSAMNFSARIVGDEIKISHIEPASAISVIVRCLDVKIFRIELHEPNLDDVYMHITGRALL